MSGLVVFAGLFFFPILAWLIFFLDFDKPGKISAKLRYFWTWLFFALGALGALEVAKVTGVRALILINPTLTYLNDECLSVWDWEFGLSAVFYFIFFGSPYFVSGWMLFSTNRKLQQRILELDLFWALWIILMIHFPNRP